MKVVTYNNLPARLPTMSIVVFWLLLDRLDASDIAWGVYYCLAVILVIASIINFVKQDLTDIFED